VSTRRWLPLVLGIAGLLAIAALASHGHPLSKSHGSGPTPVFFDYVLTSTVLVAIGIVLLFLFGIAQTRRGERPRGAPRWSWLQLVAMFALSTLIGLAVLHSHLHVASRPHRGASPPTARQGTQQPVSGNRRSVHFRWDEVAVIAALLAAAGIFAFATRTTRTPKEWRLGRREEIAVAFDESLDDLRSEPDVRRAIIAAYARMERALATAGIPRRPSEAPLEYMARALQQLDASSGAVTRLTELFERAKFSHHESDESMRDEAIAALVTVRDELRAPAEVAA
jgi:Domain of unknown function (DUF4129)